VVPPGQWWVVSPGVSAGWPGPRVRGFSWAVVEEDEVAGELAAAPSVWARLALRSVKYAGDELVAGARAARNSAEPVLWRRWATRLEENSAAVKPRDLLKILQHCGAHGGLHADQGPISVILQRCGYLTDYMDPSDLAEFFSAVGSFPCAHQDLLPEHLVGKRLAARLRDAVAEGMEADQALKTLDGLHKLRILDFSTLSCLLTGLQYGDMHPADMVRLFQVARAALQRDDTSLADEELVCLDELGRGARVLLPRFDTLELVRLLTESVGVDRGLTDKGAAARSAAFHSHLLSRLSTQRGGPARLLSVLEEMPGVDVAELARALSWLLEQPRLQRSHSLVRRLVPPVCERALQVLSTMKPGDVASLVEMCVAADWKDQYFCDRCRAAVTPGLPMLAAPMVARLVRAGVGVHPGVWIPLLEAAVPRLRSSVEVGDARDVAEVGLLMEWLESRGSELLDWLLGGQGEKPQFRSWWGSASTDLEALREDLGLLRSAFAARQL